ncbi:MAG: hypothetical protein JNK21_16150 [Rhodospirillaceae bacterium]|nr:hypothetical protein [Rhodospirillaceae bacterium]
MFVGDTSESGLAGNNMLELSARGVTRRVALAEFDLVDRRGGALNQQGAVLVGLAHEKVFSRKEEKNSAIMKRLRAVFRERLGLTADPFSRHDPKLGWRPLFSVVDARGRADERASEKANQRTVSLDHLLEEGCQFAADIPGDDEIGGEDAAARWLKENDPRG